MEATFFERFPLLNKLIFSQLDNESLVTCKEVDKAWKNCVNGQKLPWIRMIEKHIGRLSQFPRTWKKVTSKTPVQNVQELALAVKKFSLVYQDDSDGHFSGTDWTPIHVMVPYGNLELFQFFLKRWEKIILQNLMVQPPNL